jgi:RND family efflux transporter MFP subunit
MNYDAKINRAAGEEEEVLLNPLSPGDADDRRSRRRVWIGAAIVAVLLIGVWFLMHHGKKVDDSAAAGNQAPTVSVIVPGRANIAGSVVANGSLAARREMPVGSVGEGGEVVAVLVEPGQWVKAGQALAVVDSSVQVQQSAGLAAQVKVAQANAQLAQSNLDRSLKLVDRGFISKANIDQLRATRDAMNAQVGVARAALAESHARNRRLNIVAPSDGLVLSRSVERGQVVGAASATLFRIAARGEFEMLARLDEDDLAKLSVGDIATVTPVGSAQSFPGRVWQLSPVIDPQTRLGLARIAIAYSPQLRPGGFASVQIGAGGSVAPRLPDSAVLSDNRGSYVFVVGANNKVVRRDVTTGSLTGEGIAIKTGLSGSERVVLRAGAFLADGETVKPKLVTQ